MRNFDSMQPDKFALLSALLGLLLTFNLDANEQNSIGNFIVSVGQTILTKAAQIENREKHASDDDTISKKIDSMSAELCELKKQLKKK